MAGAALLCAAGVVGNPLSAAGDGPAPFPASDSEWPGKGPVRVFKWMKDNRAYFWGQRAAKQGAVVFTGDSLIGNWDKIETYFPKQPLMANRGIGGDVSRGLLFRFQEDVLDLHPKAVLILIGSNDLSAKAPTSDIVSNIGAILDEAAKAYPTMPVILCTVLPRNSPQAPIDAGAVLELDAALKEMVASHAGVTLLDLYPLFALPEGGPDPQYFREDKLHLGPAGYVKFGEAVNKVLTDLKLQ